MRTGWTGRWMAGLLGAGSIAISPLASAALVTFDDVVIGETSHAFDSDGDNVDDVVFSTTDPLGFNTTGPGANQQFIDEPGLEGTSDLDPDLRADFLNGATGSLAFGFALNSGVESDDYVASLSVFDAAGNLLGSESVAGVFGGSDFPEGVVTVSFAGTAAYATFDFTTEFGRYIIDNFEGTFGSREVPVPEPAGLGLLAAGILMSQLRRRQRD